MKAVDAVLAGKPASISDAKAKRDATAWRKVLTRSTNRKGDDVVRPTAHNVAVIVADHPEWSGVVAFDERKACPVFLHEPPFAARYAEPGTVPRALTDADRTRVRLWLEHTEGLVVKADEARAGVVVAAQRLKFDAVRDYLDALRWDQHPRIGRWLETYLGCAATPFARAVGPRWLISAVARTYVPGSKVDHVLTLEGAQGVGKSSALRALVPDPAWFTDELADLRSKDAPLGLAGKWIIELGELAALTRSEVETVKAFVSRSVDHFRAPYAATAEDYPRRSVFAGTTNASTYLRDETGGRRFWPVAVGRVDVDAIARDRDQLWAEAVVHHRQGARWYLDSTDLVELAETEQEERRIADTWEGVIAEWLDSPLQMNTHDFTLTEVLRGALNLEPARHGQIEQNRAARALRALGWSHHQVRRGATLVTAGTRVRAYHRPSVTGTDDVRGGES